MGKKIPLDISDPSKVVHLREMPTGGGSDYTLKKNILDIPSTLDRVLSLRPVSWDWKDAALNQQPEYGFIAQEVEKIFPELVYDDVWADGTTRKFIEAKKLLPYVVLALQEQQAQIDQLQKELSQIRTAIKRSTT
jgi:hypothetical protein